MWGVERRQPSRARGLSGSHLARIPPVCNEALLLGPSLPGRDLW